MSKELVRNIESSIKSLEPVIDNIGSGHIVYAEIDLTDASIEASELIRSSLRLQNDCYFIRDNNEVIISFETEEDANYYAEGINKKTLIKKIFYHAYKERNLQLKESDTEIINIGNL